MRSLYHPPLPGLYIFLVSLSFVRQQLVLTSPGFRILLQEYHGETKVAVRAETEVQLLEVEQRCIEQGINCFLVVDAGRTQIAPNTRTVLAVGPGPISAIDSVTGDLKLL